MTSERYVLADLQQVVDQPTTERSIACTKLKIVVKRALALEDAISKELDSSSDCANEVTIQHLLTQRDELPTVVLPSEEKLTLVVQQYTVLRGFREAFFPLHARIPLDLAVALKLDGESLDLPTSRLSKSLEIDVHNAMEVLDQMITDAATVVSVISINPLQSSSSKVNLLTRLKSLKIITPEEQFFEYSQVYYVLYYKYYILHTIYYVLCTIYYILYTIHYIP